MSVACSHEWHPGLRLSVRDAAEAAKSCLAGKGASSSSTSRSRLEAMSGGGFEKITSSRSASRSRLLAGRPCDHAMHAQVQDDPRFVLSTKAEHGACPEMVTPELCAATIGRSGHRLHHRFRRPGHGAAKWIRRRQGRPYPGADDDARAIDTRLGTPSPIAKRFSDRAIRAQPCAGARCKRLIVRPPRQQPRRRRALVRHRRGPARSIEALEKGDVGAHAPLSGASTSPSRSSRS